MTFVTPIKVGISTTTVYFMPDNVSAILLVELNNWLLLI